jgi:hypothetical protein
VYETKAAAKAALAKAAQYNPKAAKLAVIVEVN